MRIPSTLPLFIVTSLALETCNAAQLVWDPLNNAGATSAAGNWDTTAGNSVWWNGSSDVVWSQTSTTSGSMGATFNGPDAAPGTYAVTVDGGQIALNNLTINNSGYIFSGSSIYLNTSSYLVVANGKSVTLNCNLTGANNGVQDWTIGSGSVVNFAGGIGPGTIQPHLAGGSGSAFYLGGISSPSILYCQAPVFITNGVTTVSSTVYVGYNQAVNSTNYPNGSLTISNATLANSGNVVIVGRGAGNGVLTIGDGATVNFGTTAAHPLALVYDANAANIGTLNVFGGTLTVGSSLLTSSSSAIDFFDTGEATGSTATMNETNGTVFAWGGLLLGAGSGTPATAAVNFSGGYLYVGPGGIRFNTVAPTTSINLSGGTVAALGNWSSALPMNLGTTNGNVTFQCADNNNSAWNISLSGALTGSGGLYLTGGGTLSLSGANNYTGTTVISNGTLAVATAAFPSNGPVTLDGSTASPSFTVQSGPGQYWSVGTLSFVNAPSGALGANFQFGALAPSTTVAPMQVAGNVAMIATPSVTVSGAAIAAGTYPLITYSGALSGALPASVTVALSGGSASGYLTNLAASKTVALVVTNSTYNPALYWAVGSGVWDTSTHNWKQFGVSTNYSDGNAVVFDDSASGPSPINVTLNSVVNPLFVTFNNAAPTNYSITGTGSIAGSGILTLLGGGTVTLSGSNTYSGGTVLSAGQLNINNGGNLTASAVGTGPLTINGGALDNTSGSNVVLQASIPETWAGNFSYIGSSNSLDLGGGLVTMNTSLTLSNGGNNLIVSGSIQDNGNSATLTKTGNGTLSLPTGNSFNGLTILGGLVNLGAPSSFGYGTLTIFGGAIDNSSGAPMTLTPMEPYSWSGSFSFLGSADLNLGSQKVVIPNGPGNITLNVVSNTLTTGGAIVNNNTRVNKTGAGTWEMTGQASGQSLGLLVTAGQVKLGMSSGQAITGGNNVGMTVQSNALVLDEGNYQIHSASAIPIPVVLAGGIWDLNGFSENVDELSLSGGGVLRNGAAAASSTVNLISGYQAELSGTNCQFDVEQPDGNLNFQGPIAGTGWLVKTGSGTLMLDSNNVYSGSTVIAGGTLALAGTATLSGTTNIFLATNSAALDLSGSTDTNGVPRPLLSLAAGQTLSGFGTVTGLVSAASGAIVAPGSPSAVGTLKLTAVAGTSTLGGLTSMKLDKGHHTNDQLAASGALALGGTLALSNLTGTLAPGDNFVLFNAAGGYSGAFAALSPSRPGYPGFGLAWNTNNLAVNGTLSIVAAPVPPAPSITSVVLNGTTLTLQGTNGTSNTSFVVLESASLAVPLINWTPILTNTFSANGSFSVPLNVSGDGPQQFFSLRLQ